MTRQEIGRVSQRAPRVLGSARRQSVPDMARIFEVKKGTGRYWLRRFDESSWAALYDAARRGRPAKITKAAPENVIPMVAADPQQSGERATCWTVAMLSLALLNNVGIPVSEKPFEKEGYKTIGSLDNSGVGPIGGGRGRIGFKGQVDEDMLMVKPQISIPLDIEDVNVLKVEASQNGDIHITLESSLNYGTCRKCGRQLTKLHGYDDWVKVQHLPSFGHAVFIHYRPKRYECPDCDGTPTTTQQLAWHEANSPHTKAYDQYLLLALVNSTVQDVAIKEHLPYETVWGVVERQLAYEVDWSEFTCLGVVGIDEIARLKGHDDFIVIVSARLPDGHVALLAVLPDRKKETVKAFLASIPAHLRATIQSVCSDLYEGYVNAVREVLPRVRRVVDRFHVAKLYRAAADVVRKAELRRLKASLPPEEYKTFKGSLWAFRLLWADLRPEQRTLLQRLFALSPALQKAYDLREALTAIFNTAPSRRSAKYRLRAWQRQVRRSGLTCFDTFLNTLDQFWEEITNYFVAGDSSGFVEGFNNKILVLTRCSYGLFNLDHFFQRLYLDLERYRLFA